ncbi:hypothetical protein Fcan01_18643 [Folsomia candida]|uniref:Uncharacterized protein n=1 Tax=Folsomia candida TaxID=158441 RepID=A0A226DR13_FOLCA|nr:hypothetical protein Fcan01_18643 [Folsomia candida]
MNGILYATPSQRALNLRNIKQKNTIFAGNNGRADETPFQRSLDFRHIPGAEFTNTWGVLHHHTGDSRNFGGGLQPSHLNKPVATIDSFDAAILAKKRQKLCVDAGSDSNSLPVTSPDSAIASDNVEIPHLQVYFEEDQPYDLDDMDSDMEMPVLFPQTYPNRDPGFLLV